MSADAELFRLLRAVMRIVDRHGERKTTTGVLEIPAAPHELKELRGSLEPFRSKFKSLESLARRRVEEITAGAPATEEEIAIRQVIERAYTPSSAELEVMSRG